MRHPRFCLERYSYATYRVKGPLGDYLIRRNGRRKYYVSQRKFPNVIGFFDQKFTRLRDAADYARLMSGVEIPFDPILDLPPFLDRRGKARAA